MFSSQNSQVSSDANYIEDVFSTYLFNDATQTITNGIDLSTKGGLVWYKSREGTSYHRLTDTARGAQYALYSNATNAQQALSEISSFNTNGFGINAWDSGEKIVSWTFRKQPKFFDVVTYTGTGSVQNIAHNLGSVPGCIIVKQTSSAGNSWYVYHRTLNTTSGQVLGLNLTLAAFTNGDIFNSTVPTSTVFTVGIDSATNASGSTYVAYLFAHNAGGFGLTGTDNVISCGSFTTDGSGNATVNLGYEPQWLMVKRTNAVEDWFEFDIMRGWALTQVNALRPNTSGAESAFYPGINPTATGFNVGGTLSTSSTYIYIAIRRGPMKVPTSGTSVFLPSTVGASNNITVGFPADTAWFRYTGSDNWRCFDRLRSGYELATNLTDAEGTYNYYPTYIDWDSNSVWYQNLQNGPVVDYFFKRAPSFFDEVCYTGNRASGASTTQTLTHNLGATPELMIVKGRSNADGWQVYSSTLGAASQLSLSSTAAAFSAANPNGMWNETAPTATQFTVGANNNVNRSGSTYVAYLFATCAGVSKVGSYTGNGTVGRVIDCGFTSGARFIMLKKTSTTSDWYVYDTARGIVSGGEKSLSLNTTAAESGSSDVIDPDSSGFAVGTGASDFFNESGVTYIYLAIA